VLLHGVNLGVGAYMHVYVYIFIEVETCGLHVKGQLELK